MPFKLLLTTEANKNLNLLEQDPSQQKRLKAVQKALGYLEVDPRHPSLKTHKYRSLSADFGLEIFEAYVENNTSKAYRIFWHYGPQKNQITIIAITSHP